MTPKDALDLRSDIQSFAYLLEETAGKIIAALEGLAPIEKDGRQCEVDGCYVGKAMNSPRYCRRHRDIEMLKRPGDSAPQLPAARVIPLPAPPAKKVALCRFPGCGAASSGPMYRNCCRRHAAALEKAERDAVSNLLHEAKLASLEEDSKP
jgi:hypothetical protein